MFFNRKEAGRFLAGRLAARGYAQPIVLALSRGGVPVAFEIARALEGPLGLLGAVGDGPGPALARKLLALAEPAGPGACGHARATERNGGAARCTCLHREEGAALDVAGSSLVLVDEGVASPRAVLELLPELRRRGPRRIVLATPTVPFEALRELERELDEVFCLTRPARAPGDYCRDPEPVTDEAVLALLQRAESSHAMRPA